MASNEIWFNYRRGNFLPSLSINGNLWQNKNVRIWNTWISVQTHKQIVKYTHWHKQFVIVYSIIVYNKYKIVYPNYPTQ